MCVERILDEALVVRGGRNRPEDIKRGTGARASHHLRKEFPELLKLPSLWSPSYFVASTGQVSTDVVKRYIENQKSK